MTLSEIKKHLETAEAVNFILPDGTMVPQHFHVTEVGQITKNFIDCGGTVRNEKVINFQLWQAGDFDHRLAPQKLLSIINLSERILNIEDTEIEVEYQSETIGKYNLEYNGKDFLLTAKKTNCLASDKCGILEEKQNIILSDISTEASCCTPGGKCC
ncbi:MAG: hypothetical protein H7141_06270 [Burkholderiales bacterium]|nr:hypothetical protein [Bacteroidia bacterium]